MCVPVIVESRQISSLMMLFPYQEYISYRNVYLMHALGGMKLMYLSYITKVCFCMYFMSEFTV